MRHNMSQRPLVERRWVVVLMFKIDGLPVVPRYIPVAYLIAVNTLQQQIGDNKDHENGSYDLIDIICGDLNLP